MCIRDRVMAALVKLGSGKILINFEKQSYITTHILLLYSTMSEPTTSHSPFSVRVGQISYVISFLLSKHFEPLSS